MTFIKQLNERYHAKHKWIKRACSWANWEKLESRGIKSRKNIVGQIIIHNGSRPFSPIEGKNQPIGGFFEEIVAPKNDCIQFRLYENRHFFQTERYFESGKK
jgi:hypothetical protein